MRTLPCAASALVLLLLPSIAAAQSRASERASVSQTVDGTQITVEYSRPLVRGRAQLFGGVVPWGEVWTPGANRATALDLSQNVTINGHPVPAGRWSVWMVVAEDEPWELVLDPRATLYHTDHPEPTDEQIRFAIALERAADPVEVLTWSFPDVRRTGTTVRMDWGTTRVPLEIEVEPRPKSIAADVGRPYVGAWEVAWEPDPDESDEPSDEGPPPPSPFDLRLVSDSLLVAYTALPGWSPLDMILMPLAEGVFRPGFVVDGAWFEAVGELVLEFEYDEGRPVRFVVRNELDEVVARGSRMAVHQE